MLRSVRYVTSSVSMLGAGSSISSASAVMLFAWRSSHHVGDTEHERRRQIIASIAAEHVSCIASNSVADTLASVPRTGTTSATASGCATRSAASVVPVT